MADERTSESEGHDSESSSPTNSSIGIPEARDRRRACLRRLTLPRRIHLWIAVFDTRQIPAALVGPPTDETARSTALFFFLFVSRFMPCHLPNRRQSIQ